MYVQPLFRQLNSDSFCLGRSLFGQPRRHRTTASKHPAIAVCSAFFPAKGVCAACGASRTDGSVLETIRQGIKGDYLPAKFPAITAGL
jgi:hypothetical protein